MWIGVSISHYECDIFVTRGELFIQFEVNEWRERMYLVLLNATMKLWVSENGRMSVMGMLGTTTLDSSAPLDLPRSAPLRLSDDGQSLSVDDYIRQ